ncbi:pyridoxal phosphate-dependent aminotransferase [Azospirillum canadense]|uniref:pyridoxal phosphate-dependent aminotransferase n=1 Tax=Azospirillum canadense TaxID=403962 RepID=UPI002226A2A4|nr:pyridoxal phosphate-dependent aminotransferase [Azospirillum canadense]MCW2238026.1 aspartate/methionine/tyrosine aminotransferase [Azospirillum canadense]
MVAEFDIRPGIQALPASAIVTVANHGRGRDGLIPLWFGEGDLPTPDFIREAADRAIRDGHVFYTYQRGLPPLREVLSAYLERVHRVPVPVDRITVTTSGMAAIMNAMQMLVDPGDEVAVVSPVWPNVMAAVRVQGGVPVEVPMTLGNQGWTLDLERLFAACGPRTRAIFVNSPGNPTGWIMPRDDMARVMAFARERGLWVISDEVYARLVYDGRTAAPSFLEVAEPEDKLIVVNSFSKNWAMTGWRLGWMVTPTGLGPVLENLVQFSTSGTPGFIQMAGLAAIEQGEPWVAETVERCRKARDLVCGALAAFPRVRVQPAPGAFYAFFQVEGETDSVALATRIIDEALVGLAPGAAFGQGGEGALRLCYASRLDKLEEAMARLARVLG